jgi:2,4-dienoyl-CoA reductase-like NADH-dependent reductase (Old Yellow Enzyme family)
MRFPLEVFDAVRAAFPAGKPVWVRVSATDWVDGGWDPESTVAFGQALKARGCAALHVSTGGVSPLQKIALGPGYQVPFAQRVKAEVGCPPSRSA